MTILERGQSPSDDEITKEAERQVRENGAGDVGMTHQTMDICSTSPVPEGWIKVDDHWNPTSCGNPTSIQYNVWTIARYDDKPIGARMTVCSSTPPPIGWVVVGTAWDPTKCGHPTSIIQNMNIIKRVK